jgi:hypothetical protein
MESVAVTFTVWGQRTALQASPELAAIINAVRQARRDKDRARKAWLPLREAMEAAQAEHPDPSWSARSEAREAIPVPEIIAAPPKPPAPDDLVRVVMHQYDGSVRDADLAKPRKPRAMTMDEIKKAYAADPATRRKAANAFYNYNEACFAAECALTHPAVTAARDAWHEVFKAHVQPASELYEAAQKALWAFQPRGAHDTAAHAIACLEMVGGKLRRDGGLKLADELDPLDEAQPLLAILFRALIPAESPAALLAVEDFSPSPEDAAAPTEETWREYSTRLLFALRISEKFLKMTKAEIAAEVASWSSVEVLSTTHDVMDWASGLAKACAINIEAADARMMIGAAAFANGEPVDEDTLANARPEEKEPAAGPFDVVAATERLRDVGVLVWPGCGFHFPHGLSREGEQVLADYTEDEKTAIIDHAVAEQLRQTIREGLERAEAHA